MAFRVVTPAADRALLTIEEARAAAGVTGTDQDVALTALALAVSDMIAREAGVVAGRGAIPTLRVEACEETFARPRSGAIRLSRRFVDVTAVTEGAVALSADDYEVDDQAGILVRVADGHPRCWGDGVTVTYEAGLASVPGDLKRAAVAALREISAAESRDPLLRSETVDGIGSQSFQVGGSGRDSGSPLPPGVVDALGPYTTVSIG